MRPCGWWRGARAEPASRLARGRRVARRCGAKPRVAGAPERRINRGLASRRCVPERAAAAHRVGACPGVGLSRLAAHRSRALRGVRRPRSADRRRCSRARGSCDSGQRPRRCAGTRARAQEIYRQMLTRFPRARAGWYELARLVPDRRPGRGAAAAGEDAAARSDRSGAPRADRHLDSLRSARGH